MVYTELPAGVARPSYTFRRWAGADRSVQHSLACCLIHILLFHYRSKVTDKQIISELIIIQQSANSRTIFICKHLYHTPLMNNLSACWLFHLQNYTFKITLWSSHTRQWAAVSHTLLAPHPKGNWCPLPTCVGAQLMQPISRVVSLQWPDDAVAAKYRFTGSLYVITNFFILFSAAWIVDVHLTIYMRHHYGGNVGK